MRQQFDEAVSCYDEVLSVESESISALHNKALALILMGKFDDAEACYMRIQRVTKLEPNTLAPLQELEGILAGLKDSELTIEATPSGKLREDYSSELHGREAGRGVQRHLRQCGKHGRGTPPERW